MWSQLRLPRTALPERETRGACCQCCYEAVTQKPSWKAAAEPHTDSAPLPSTGASEKIFLDLGVSAQWYICTGCSASEVRMWRILPALVRLQQASHMRDWSSVLHMEPVLPLCLTLPSGHNGWAFPSHRLSLPTSTSHNIHPQKKHTEEKPMLWIYCNCNTGSPG